MALKHIQIGSKIGEDGTKEMEIVNYDKETLPIPQIEVPSKITGFECITIHFIDRNVIIFLGRFRPLFAKCPIHLCICAITFSAVELIFRNIWPLMSAEVFRRLRHFEPSFLTECPSLRFVSFTSDDLFTEFPADDSATASDAQAMTKWLFTPRSDDVPKVFNCSSECGHAFNKKIDDFKTAFMDSSSPANFIVIIQLLPNSDHSIVSPFDLTNELAQERLTLTWMNDIGCLSDRSNLIMY